MTRLGWFAEMSVASSAGWMTLKLLSAGSAIALPARPKPTATMASEQTTMTFFTQSSYAPESSGLPSFLYNRHREHGTATSSPCFWQSTDRVRDGGEPPANRSAGCCREPLRPVHRRQSGDLRARPQAEDHQGDERARSLPLSATAVRGALRPVGD